MHPARSIDRLLEIMAALRTPNTGCPWDLKQDFHTIAPCTLEEAYEVVDAIERNDMIDLCEELGDLLLQVVFHARMAEEKNIFSFPDVIEAITSKLIRRHPHIFGDTKKLTPEDVKNLWGQIKAEEKAQRATARAAAGYVAQSPRSRLDDVPASMPALTRAVKLQNKASGCGFDWHDARQVLAKIREETDEIEHALTLGADQNALRDEIGDLFFAVANLARHLNIDPEEATRSTNEKFKRRFAYIEITLAAQNKDIVACTLAEMDALWNEAKSKGL